MPKKIKSEPVVIPGVGKVGDAPSALTAATAPPTECAPTVRTTRAPTRTPRNHRELAEAIFEECDAVAIGCELLGPNNERTNNSVKARIWETLVDFLFGKLATPGTATAEPKVRVIWDLPSPPHEKNKP